MSGLRKSLEPVKGEHRVIVARGPGYMLVADPDSVDALHFERLVVVARKELADERYEERRAPLRGGAPALAWRAAGRLRLPRLRRARGEPSRR